jgi:hypothetical protein
MRMNTVRRGTRRPTAAVKLVSVLGLLTMLAALVSPSASVFAAGPTITAVSPGQDTNDSNTAITISGSGFVATPTVTLGPVRLDGVVHVDGSTLTAAVPPDLPGGMYDLTVTNPDAQSDTLPDAFTVQLAGDGAVGRWQRVSSMVTGRYSFVAASIGNYLYALGGAGSGGRYSSVERATIRPDGSLEPWQMTAAMTTPRTGLAAVIIGGYIYAMGGADDSYTDSGVLGSVERAAILPDGSLGPWQPASAMTTAREYFAAVVSSGYLYAMGGLNNNIGGTLSNVERAAILPDGSLGPWQPAASMITPRFTFAAVTSGSYLYALGGHNAGGNIANVECAAINPDGSLSPWQPARALTGPRSSLAAVATGGYVYVVGGMTGAYPTRNVQRVTINTDGSLSPWQSVTDLIEAKSSLAAVASSGYLYALGGGIGGHSQTIVERAKLNPPEPPLLDYGISINNGALFTNKVDVTLSIGAPIQIDKMQVSNDGGFTGATWEPYAQLKPWQITQYGSYVIPRVVYVRHKDYDGNVSTTYQDDIILDVNAPNGSVDVQPGATSVDVDDATDAVADPADVAANARPRKVYLPLVASCYPPPASGPANATLNLSASDDVSGVDSMMISNRSDFLCASWEPYKTTRAWYVPGGTTTVHVKYRDNAGNVSPVATDTINR